MNIDTVHSIIEPAENTYENCLYVFKPECVQLALSYNQPYVECVSQGLFIHTQIWQTVKVTTQCLLVARLRLSNAVPSLPHTPTGTTSPF
jgi:hypothetical protein